MLPRVDDKQWHRADTDIALMVVDLLHHQPAAQRLPGEHTPTDALHIDRGCGELGLQGLESAEVLVDRAGQLAVGAASAVGAHVGPEDAVQQVSAEVEGEAAAERVDRGEVTGLAGCGESLEGVVGALHVGGMVLAVVQGDDLTAVVRLEGSGGIGEVGQGVDGHVNSFSLTANGTAVTPRPPRVAAVSHHRVVEM